MLRTGQSSEHSGVPDQMNTPLSQIKGFPVIAKTPAASAAYPPSGGSSGHTAAGGQAGDAPPYSINYSDPYSLLGDGFNGPEQLAYPQMWANMFGIKVDGSEASDMDYTFNGGAGQPLAEGGSTLGLI
jgi:hypothetical protein